MKTGVIVGGTGAQGAAIVRYLASLNQYDLRVLTRNLTSPQAKELAKLGNVELIQSSPTGYDEKSYLRAAEQADFAFINTDGFSIGEVAETYWGIRFYELSKQAGVKNFIYSSLDNLQEAANFDDDFDAGHYRGKARVVEYLKSKSWNSSNDDLSWSVITSGPYIEMLHETLKPHLSDDGSTYLFRYPMADGALAFIHLDDFAQYVEHMVAHPKEVAGKELKIATAHASGVDIAESFTQVTGKPARYVSISAEQWVTTTFAHESRGHHTHVGSPSLRKNMTADVETFFFPQTYGQNFSKWWNVWRRSGNNEGIVRRDYDELDKVLPGRVRSVEEWMRKVGYTTEARPVLKQLNEKLKERGVESSVPQTVKRGSAWG